MISRFIDRIYYWQNFIGAVIGAATPILFWLFLQWYQRHKGRIENLYKLEKLFVVNINSVLEVHKDIKHFLDNKFSELISNIEQTNQQNSYSIATAFFPFFFVHTIDENFLDIKTGSGYLDNRLLQLIKMSKDFSLIIDDLRRQFEHTITTNQWVAINKLNSPEVQKREYKENLERFGQMLKQNMSKSIKVYLKLLISARVTANKIRDLGIIRWRLKFTSSFKYFKNKKAWKKYINETFDRIDKFLKNEIDKQYKEITGEFIN